MSSLDGASELASELIDVLVRAGYSTAVGVPDSYTACLIQKFDKDPDLGYIAAANEGNAVAIACGLYLAGEKAVLVIQNSGLGSATNPITSLASLYRIPVLLIVGQRGAYPGDAPEHALMGTITSPLLDLLGIRTLTLPETVSEVRERVGSFLCGIADDLTSGAIIVPRRLGAPLGERTILRASKLPSREEVVARILAFLPPDAVVLSSVGIISDTLHSLQSAHARFYSTGALGHTTSLAFGLAMGRPAQTVCALEGDGSLLMHLGAAGVIAYARCRNLIHCVLDDGVYATTGCQPTPLITDRLADAANALGYPFARTTLALADLDEALRAIAGLTGGPYFLHVLIRADGLAGHRKSVFNKTSPPEQARLFAERLART